MCKHFAQIFSVEDLPDELFTNNGEPFASTEFAQFAWCWGFKHNCITELPLEQFPSREVQTDS